jgi:hypothetical protein
LQPALATYGCYGGEAHKKADGAVAQSVEQRTENPCVGGSIPPHTTKASGNNQGLFYLCTSFTFFIRLPAAKLVGYCQQRRKKTSGAQLHRNSDNKSGAFLFGSIRSGACIKKATTFTT